MFCIKFIKIVYVCSVYYIICDLFNFVCILRLLEAELLSICSQWARIYVRNRDI
jgi:hypothetical protein